MKAVGIRELKARLSQYVREVRRGEVILVTDRGEVVAELRQPGRGPPGESETDYGLRRLAEAGGLVVREPHDPALYRASPVRVESGTAERLLDDERADDP
ncbi:MAG: type II toxin-antitoxin system prevent-host-death family antitoxin [Gemmatimonadetes bacterium]|nr:type II toxin-antitoxin system prevent-host-death family antitoxin [Gemmatimonadota bacterium]